MSLPASQNRTLNRIEQTLLADDPRLGSLFTIFTRLTLDETMPGTERVKAGLWQLVRPAVVVPITVIAILGVLMVSLLTPSRRICGVTPPARGHSQSWSRTAACPSGPAARYERPYIR